MKRRGVLVLLIASVLALARLPAAERVAGAEAPLEGISVLLDERAAAIREGDRRAFLESVDDLDPGFVRRQRLLFDGFQQLEIRDYELEVPDALTPLTGQVEIDRYGADALPTVLHVQERYRIPGYDVAPALEDLFLTFVRREEGWKIVSDQDVEDVGLLSARKLWEFGPVETAESEHFLYVSHPDLAGAAGSVLAAAERALATVEARWPLAWRTRVVLLAPSTTEELSRLIQATFDLENFVAFAISGLDRGRDWALVGPRIMLHSPNFTGHSEASRQGILTHELTHIATRQLAGPFVPVFVDEGVAEWVAGSTSLAYASARVRAGAFDRALPLDLEFFIGSLAEILASYQEATSAVLYASSAFGEQAVAEFYRRLGAVRLAPGTWRYHVGRAMRAAFGIGFPRFERRWAAWLEQTAA